MIDIDAGRVLRSAIRVADQTGRWPLSLGSHHHGRQWQLGPHVITHRPSDDLAGCQIEDRGQIQPPFAGCDIGDVGEPDCVWRGCREVLRQQVRRDRQIMTTVGGTRPEPASRQCADTMATHQSFDATTAASMTLRPQGGMHPRRSVSPLMPRLESAHLGKQCQVRHRPCAWRPDAPVVIAAARHTEHAAHDIHRPGGRMLLDKSELHRGISAKMPTAFFKMSRSIRARSSSLRSRAISDD